jgi:hypothetical protein
MGLQFKYILSGKGFRRRKMDGKAVINRLPRFIQESGIGSDTRLKGAPKEDRNQRCQASATKPDNAYRSATGRAGNGHNRILKMRRQGVPVNSRTKSKSYQPQQPVKTSGDEILAAHPCAC